MNKMILYHGGRNTKKFDEFRLPETKKDLSGHSSETVTKVIWLSDKKEDAKSYSGGYRCWVYTCEFTYDKIFIESNDKERKALEKEFGELNPDLISYGGGKRGEIHNQFVEFLKSKGYQGEYIDGVYQVFDPKDLKIINAERI